MKRHLINPLLFLIVLLSSCANYHKNIYFQGVDRNGAKDHSISNFAPATIQIGDILAINIKSLNADASAVFNTGGTKYKDSNGWLVDKNGEVQLPLVHNIKVSGYTLEEAQDVIQKTLLPYLKEPQVTLSILNFRVSILGDVINPNVYSISDERISIPQAISLAGDLSSTANRKNILLIREVNGSRKYINIDLTSADLFDSPYYYLKTNDILYVEPGGSKFAANSLIFKVLPLILSAISIIVVTYRVTR